MYSNHLKESPCGGKSIWYVGLKEIPTTMRRGMKRKA
jgi:hypothetical protein